MNVFVIPSWYPSEEFPISGIFCKEQALAKGIWRPDWNIMVSCWGQETHHLPLKKLHQWPRSIFRYFKQSRKHINELLSNVTEFHTPLLQWNQRIVPYQKYFNQILEINRKHLIEASYEFGPIDIIHAHVCAPAGIIAQQLSREFSIPYVITEHSCIFPFPRFLEDNRLKPEIQRAFDGAQAIIGMSPYQVETLQQWGINNVHLVPNCVDIESFAVTETLLTQPFFSLAYQLSSKKGTDDLLQAIHIAKNIKGVSFPQGHFRIAGLDPANHYKKIADHLGIANEIEWLGLISRERSIQEFQSCGCFVLPSHQESFGMVYIEALACGKPVISARNGGSEFIVEKEQGILVDPQDPLQLAEALIAIYQQKKNFSPHNIRQRIEERFSSKIFVDNLEKVYRV